MALKDSRSPVWLIDFDTYLQGSYRNYTNTVRDHDVDLVVQLNQTFAYDTSSLTPQEAYLASTIIPPAIYPFEEFRQSVIDHLRNVFGWSKVKVGAKAVRVTGEPGVKMDADVVICKQHRTYTYFNGDPKLGYFEGIAFYDQRDGRMIINYPRQLELPQFGGHQATR